MRSNGEFLALARLLLREADRCVLTRLAAALLLVVTGSLLTALAPLALKNLVDVLAATPPSAVGVSGTALTLGAAYLLALSAGRLLTEVRPLLLGAAEQRLHVRVSRRYFTHLLALPFTFHASRQTGAVVQGLSQATAACQLLLVNVVQATPIVVELATVLAVLAHLGQPALVLIFMASALAYTIVFALGSSRLSYHARSVSGAGLHAHALLTDHLLNIEAIKCFGVGPLARERYALATRQVERSWLKLHRHRALVGVAVAMVFAASVAASLTVAANAVHRGALTIGGFVLASVYMLQMVRPLEMLGNAVRDIGQATEFARPLLDVLREDTESPGPSEPPANEEPPGDPPRPVSLRFADVHLAYTSDRPVLQGLDLDIVAGSTMALVGASGSGKSSVARLLLRLLEASSGQVLWDGRPANAWPIEALRARIGLVPQDTALFNDSIAANIALGRPGAAQIEIEDAARRAQLHDFILSLPEGYDTLVGERGLKLSGGERQRIAIARALLKRPQVYVFDEATSMLDGATEEAILKNLRKVCAGCTTLIITHRLAAARDADEIAVLEAGRIVERGSHAALLRLGGRYAAMWRLQSGPKPHPMRPGRGSQGKGRALIGRQAFARNRAWHRRRA